MAYQFPGDFSKIHLNQGRYISPILHTTLGQKSTFYPEITKNLMFEKCEFCKKCDFRNVNFEKNEISEMWILLKVGIFNVWTFW